MVLGTLITDQNTRTFYDSTIAAGRPRGALPPPPPPPPPKRSTPPKIQEMQAPSLPFLPTLKIFQGPLQKGGDSMLMVQKSLRKQQKKPTKHGEKHPLYHHPYSKQTLLHINY